MPRLKLFKPAIASITPFFLFATSFSLSVTLLPTPYSLLPVSAQTTDARKAEADHLWQQGNQQYQTGQFQAAVNSWQQSLQIYRTRKDRESEGRILVSLGAVYASLGDYTQAIDYTQQSLTIAREIKDHQSEGEALGNLGSFYFYLGNYAESVDYTQQSLAIAREFKDRQSEGNALGNLGTSYGSLGNYAKAVEYAQQRLVIAREFKDRRSEGVALGNLGEAYLSLGSYTKSIDYTQQWLVIAREIEDRQSEGTALGNLGTAYSALGNYVKAIEYIRQSFVIARAIKDRRGEGVALSALGNAYLSLGVYHPAIEFMQQSLALTREIGNRQGESTALSDLGDAYLRSGDYTQAVDYTQQSLTIAREIKNRQGEGAALNILGNIYYSLGNYATAIEYMQQSLVIAREIKDRRSEGGTLGDLGNIYLSLGDHNQALDYAQQQLATAQEIKDGQGEGAALNKLGNIYDSLGNYAKAIDYIQQSLLIAQKIRNRQNEAAALINLGNIYDSSGNFAKAIEYSQQGFLIARAINDADAESIALNNLGVALFHLKKLPAAEIALNASIKLRESIRIKLGQNDANKISFFETQKNSYGNLQKALVAQNKSNAALEIAERGRGRAFVELLAERLSGQNKGSRDPIRIQPPNIQQIEQVAKSQNSTLVQYSIIYDAFRIQGKQTWQEAALYIWVIQPTGEITFRQVDLKPLWQQHNASLAKLIIGNQEFLAVRSRNSLGFAQRQPDLPTLHQLLIDPIATLLPNDPNAHVIFIPQGSLFQVPFPALQDANGTYLIQKHTILTAPSIQVLGLTQQQRQRQISTSSKTQVHNALVVGNPAMPSVASAPGAAKQPLAPLPGAETEAKAIAPLLNTQAILGAQGTKAAIMQKMPQASIIHLATHGLLDDVRGLGSAIALAPSGNDNGWLTGDEILNMKLQANLVVLSACNTAGGRMTGDGVIGLSRSLISAGVPSVIVSLWAVPDAPTEKLMTVFYRNLKDNPNKAQALRQAMLTTMETHPEPKDWAAFTLIGEAE